VREATALMDEGRVKLPRGANAEDEEEDDFDDEDDSDMRGTFPGAGP